MPGYVYGGDQFDAHLPVPYPSPQAKGEPRTRPAKTIAECGTNAGHNAHWRKKEPVCPPCRAAHNEYQREYKRRTRAGKRTTGWTKAKCGTYAGYQLHFRYAVPMCDPCKQAGSQYNKASHAKRKAA